ncbi:MAG: spermidine/putrescine transport system ATP-binding protein [Actinomycetota bacterium]|jgi:putative spermidine/putrescine transport system ATP-binding protein
MSDSVALSIRGLSKRFGDVIAAEDVSIDIREGEFFAMLGPSGSGKTTVLRMIAGFEKPDSGTIVLAGDDITRSAAFDRDVNTVFQDYALFPHLSVMENVEYGLMVTKVPKAERRRRATEVLASVRLDGYGDRMPNQLSGGQRQRVALARALVNEPKVLLLDEPLGALDLKLREEMQVELKSIQQRVGITFVFVTHDQGEALSMSDRIAVFNAGRVEQIGTPRDVYERPATAFVASFVGNTNLLSGERAERLFGRPGTFTLRPEHVDVNSDGPGVEATVQTVQFLGADTRLHCTLDDGTSLVASGVSARLGGITAGSKVRLTWNSEAAFAVSD